MKAVKAIPDRKGCAELIQACHPLIDEKKAVPIDLHLGRDFRILVITGSNAGGKTIAMKTLGLLALMNQAGLFIPEEGTRLPVYEHVYAVIGDDQSIQYNLSTFSSYITQMTDFLDQCGEKDLVLLDELGSGTDPIEGAALAQAVAEYLNRRKTPAIITSHFSEMKKLAYETEGIQNAFVEFDEKTLAPTYHLIIGMAGNSNAFNICRRLGMNGDILQRAEALKEESPLNNMEMIMARLNKEIRETEKEKETIIKELKKAASKAGKQGLSTEIDKARNAVDGLEIPRERQTRQPVNPEMLKKGTAVYVDTLESAGTVVKVSGKKVTVSCGNLTVTVGAEHCFAAEPRDMPKPVKTEPVRKAAYREAAPCGL